MHAHDGAERPGEPPEAVFRTLAHPIRERVIAALAAADDGLRYQPLRERVAVRDKGKFNYHLSELRDGFVEKHAERYELTEAGERAHELVAAGTLGTVRVRRSFRTDAPCRECGGRLDATVDGATVRLDCPACGSCHLSLRFPPGGALDRSDDALLDAVDAVHRQTLSSLGDGVCPRCRGRVEVDATTDGWSREHDPRSLTYGFEYACRDCGGEWTTTVGEAVLVHPAVVAFYHDHGVDVRDVHVWDLEFAATDHDTRIRSRDPLRLELRPQCGNDELVLVVADDGSVVRDSRHTKFTARDTWFDRSGTAEAGRN